MVTDVLVKPGEMVTDQCCNSTVANNAKTNSEEANKTDVCKPGEGLCFKSVSIDALTRLVCQLNGHIDRGLDMARRLMREVKE